MILGTGNDLCDIRRIEAVLARHGARFTTRVFTDIEREKSDRRKARAASYAKRFAAKEACAKALGTGMAKGVSWRDIGVENAPGGRPSLVLTGRAKARLEAMTPFGHAAVLHLTLTDDFPMAQAFVIIEAVPIAPMSPADVAARDAKGYSEFSQPGALMTEHTDTHTPPAPAPEAAKPRPKEGGIGETIRVVIEALLIALVIRTFAFQPFNIPSGSLIPTVLIGDYLFVSKYSYGYSKHSFPFSIVPLEGRVWAAEPKRGDIAVFKLPKDNETDYIKRVIGLPGDKVQVLDGRLRINGQPVQKEAAGTSDQADAFGRVTKVPLFKETLPGGVSYTVLEREGDRGYWDNTIEYTVPAGHFFMMGDNRDNSTDSRDLQSVGFVPYENFVGRAEVIFFSIDDQTPAWQVWKWPTAVRWERLFQKIR